MSERRGIYHAIDAERDAQNAKWGDQSGHTLDHWITILAEEVGEAAAAALEYEAWGRLECTMYMADGGLLGRINDRADLRAELIQVAAVAVAMIEAIDVEVEE